MKMFVIPIEKLKLNFYSNPIYLKVPIEEFPPIEGDQFHFMDITNSGLKPGANLNQRAIELWTRIDKKIQQINKNAHRYPREEL